MRGAPGRRCGVFVLLLSLGAAVDVAPAAAQDGDGVPLVGAVTAGFSLRDTPGGLRIGEDARSAALRLQWTRSGAQPWIEAGWYERPGLDCASLGDDACDPDGWTGRLGAFLPLAGDSDGGLEGGILAGIGAGFSTRTELSYVLGAELFWAGLPVEPLVAFRWERFPGLTNVLMLTAGLRVGPFH